MVRVLRIALPVLLLAAALLGGAAAGDLLRPRAVEEPAAKEPALDAGAEGSGKAAAAHAGAAAPPEDHAAEGSGSAGHGGTPEGQAEDGGDLAYLKFPQQFFVPMVRGGTLQAVMVLTLSLEMPAEAEEVIFRQEHRLRDALLRSLLIHANSGGFDGNFTAEAHLALLRETLLADARAVAGPEITAVLIGDIARQEQ